MGQVDIAINGKTYRIACEDGEEQRLSNLAAMVDAHVHDLIEQVGQIGQSRLLVMASLLIADEFVDLRDSRDEAVVDDAPGDDDLALEAEERAVAALDALAERIERIGARRKELVDRETPAVRLPPHTLPMQLTPVA